MIKYKLWRDKEGNLNMCKAKYILPILAISAGLSFTSAIANTAGINLENPLIQVSAINPARNGSG